MRDGISITMDIGALNDALVRLGPLVDFDSGALMDRIAVAGEGQTRRRITEEKTAPDGTPWKPNRAGTPTLQQTGRNLLDSVASSSDVDEAEWGASWEFAHVHQDGAVIVPKTATALRFMGPNGAIFAQKVTIPARPFVGLSEDNRSEIDDLVTDFFGDLARDAAR